MRVLKGVWQFKTEADVSKFRNSYHAQVLEKMLKAKWMPIWAMKRNSVTKGTIPATPGMVIRKKSRPNMGEFIISST